MMFVQAIYYHTFVLSVYLSALISSYKTVPLTKKDLFKCHLTYQGIICSTSIIIFLLTIVPL